jgi:glycosyltransferase involved in cell wall biosynthesis
MDRRIGVALFDSRLGRSGGLDVYVRSLVAGLSGLADCASSPTFNILIRSDEEAEWLRTFWPEHVVFTRLVDVEPRQPLARRAARRFRRSFGLPVPPHYGEPYLVRQIDELDLDLIHYPRTLIYPLSIVTPCVLTFFDLQHEYYPQFFTEDELAARASTYRPSVDKATHLIVPSDYTRRTLHEKYAVPFEKMSLIPVGISDTFRRREAAEVERVRARYQLPDEFIYYPANPWQHKNHARLIAALRIYRARYGECPWLVLTGRLYRERREAMSLAIAAGVDDRVIDLAFVEPEDLPALYTAAKLMVFPSLFEGFGIPLVEAMACGCPIAAADATTIPEITNGAALLFDPLDSDQMAEAIHRVLTDADLRQALVAQGYDQLPRFAWDTIVPQLIAVYKRLARENRPSQGHKS